MIQRLYSNSRVDRAGEHIGLGHGARDMDAWLLSYEIVSHWRSLHAYPLNAVAMTLKNRALAIDVAAIIPQRLKRYPSIRRKLQRPDKKNMALSQMQDIGGCRAVMSTVEQAYELKQRYEDYAKRSSDRGPELIHKWTKDYVFSPKADGYRGIHFVFKYRTTSKEAEHYNGLRIEVQIRSRLQHAWAMAVETASVRTHQALKSGEGREPWRRFFCLMGSAIAMREELPLVPGTDEIDLYREIRKLASELKVIPLFEGIGHAINILRSGDVPTHHSDDLYLLELDSENREMGYRAFSRRDFVGATAEYASAERRTENNPNVHVVLVRVGDIGALRNAYPSYFLDASEFITLIKEASDKGDGRTPRQSR